MTVQNDLIIVKMTSEHISDILELENLSFAIPWSQKMFLDEMSNQTAVYLVAICNGKVIGYVGMWIILGEGNITNIAVHPQYRQQKVASKLLDALMHLNNHNYSNIEDNVKAMTLEVRAGNVAAINLYESFGFVKEGIRKKYYFDNEEDAVIMWKKF